MDSTRKIRIGELAQQLNVEKFVIRFWEKEFNLRPHRTEGGQRFYTEKDLALFKQIQQLLYEEGFTIAGARKYLETNKEKTIITASRTSMQEEEVTSKQLAEYIIAVQKKLLKLRDLL